MRLITQKQLFCGDFSIIKNTRLTSILSFSKLFIAFLLIFLFTLLINTNSFAEAKNSQQVPAKKATIIPKKKPATSKIVKGKKGSKSKKSVIVKKDTLPDIDPASTKSPLYNN